ncbi:MAG TPA: ParB/RepB/Spo0J family partition protein [Candidatus Paceibacterota bacterium]|nr:ParB/RepB/Spo0J family partition protein [Candidatus Paceibacterota bacterium]
MHIVHNSYIARKEQLNVKMYGMSDQPYIPTKYDSVFWVEVDRISPNPYQPRIEFNEENLKSLAESIRQYGVLMPLVVTRKDIEKPNGGIQTAYELIAGERRLRASKLVGLKEVPVVIRAGEQTDRMKLELAIIENLQREDLNAIDRARALAQLAENFGLSHAEIGAKVGKSREYVSNSIRLLALPEPIQQAVVGKEITEGHARALLMLTDRPEEQDTLFKEIMLKKTTVRFVEQMARRIATDKIRKHDKTPEMMELERSLTETLGTRVMIENRPNGGRVLIEFFSPEDLSHIAAILAERQEQEAKLSAGAIASVEEVRAEADANPAEELASSEVPVTDVQPATSQNEQDEDLYSISSFTV